MSFGWLKVTIAQNMYVSNILAEIVQNNESKWWKRSTNKLIYVDTTQKVNLSFVCLPVASFPSAVFLFLLFIYWRECMRVVVGVYIWFYGLCCLLTYLFNSMSVFVWLTFGIEDVVKPLTKLDRTK